MYLDLYQFETLRQMDERFMEVKKEVYKEIEEVNGKVSILAKK